MGLIVFNRTFFKFRLNVENILWNTINPTKHCHGPMDVNNVVKAWNDEWTLNILDFAQIVDLVLVFGFNDEHNSEGLQIYNQL